MKAAIMTLGAIMCLALAFGCGQSRQQRATTAVILSHGAGDLAAGALEVWSARELERAQTREEGEAHRAKRRTLEAIHARWRSAHATLAALVYRYVAEDAPPGLWEAVLTAAEQVVSEWAALAQALDGVPDPPGWLLSMIGGGE